MRNAYNIAPTHYALRMLTGKLHRRLRGLVESGGGGEVGGFEDLAAFLGVGAHQADHHGHVGLHLVEHLHDALGYRVAAGDAAEDVEHDGLDVGVTQDDAQGGLDLVLPGPAADVEEVGRGAPV